MRGKIIKGVGGFYYVHVPRHGIYECKARGIFRRLGIKPLVGDDVEMKVLPEEEMTGSIEKILPRRSQLVRPASANVDQAMIVFAAADPEPNFGLLDRFMIMMQKQHVDMILCFNKIELISPEKLQQYRDIYRGSGCRTAAISVKTGEGIDSLRAMLQGKTTVVAGPSGVGKSSLTNVLYPEAGMVTGAISNKIRRGRNTTRHTELFAIGDDTYWMDTPGFSSLYVVKMEPEELKDYYPEFEPYFGQCRFNGCNHMSEPDCAVKRAVENGEINRARYEGYRHLFEELRSERRY